MLSNREFDDMLKGMYENRSKYINSEIDLWSRLNPSRSQMVTATVTIALKELGSSISMLKEYVLDEDDPHIHILVNSLKAYLAGINEVLDGKAKSIEDSYSVRSQGSKIRERYGK